MEDQEISGELEVKYTVKELFGGLQKSIDVGFAEVKTSLNLKADKADLEPINKRLDEHGREIGWLKDRQKEDEVATQAISSAKTRAAGFWWKLAGAVSGVPLAVLSVMEIISLVRPPHAGK